MQYSLVDRQKLQPFPKGKGVCEICNAETLAKCGEKVMWHWAHKAKRSCDPWWESETEWHRNWKAYFPEDYREVAFQCEQTGEIHRADIITDRGIVVEIQNSPISLEELRSREAFYKNLLWLVNGEKFRSRFEILSAPLPNPDASEFEDIVFFGTGAIAGEAFWRKSENPEATEKSGAMVRLHPARKIEQSIRENYIGHHPFRWTRPHVAWLEANCPVLIDFGKEFLWRIENYRGQFRCVRAISKRKFVHDVMVEANAADIGTRFYPIHEGNQMQGPQ